MLSTFTQPLLSSVEDSLARLAAFEPGGFPVVSVYLNLAPNEHGRVAGPLRWLQREFKALGKTFSAGSSELHSFLHDTEEIVSWVTSEIEPAARAVAIFACSGAQGFFEAIQLGTPFERDLVSADNQPHLYHLAELDERYPRYAALLADMNHASIHVFALGHVIAAEHVTGRKVHKVKVGGWSQPRYQRRADNAHHENAKEAIERLAVIVREDKISQVILAGDEIVVSLLQAQLPPELVSMVQVMKLDIHTSENDLLTATLASLRRREAGTAAEKVDRLLQQYRGQQLAVVGAEETLEAMTNGRVEELLISSGMEECRSAPPVVAETGVRGSHQLQMAPMPDLLVTRARQTGAAVTFIEDPALLSAVGGVGGFLRWRESAKVG